jgi:hypothetical protein
MGAKLAPVLEISGTSEFEQKSAPTVEVLDTAGLAAKLQVPESWVRGRVQPRTAVADRIPHLRFGRYVRFYWGSVELTAWIESRKAR